MKTNLIASIVLGTVTIAAVLLLSAWKTNDNVPADNSISVEKTIERAAVNIKKINNKSPEDKKTVENNKQPFITNNVSLSELAGPVHNEYGIRDDIMAYIDEQVPKDNEMARTAVIRLASIHQATYYSGNQEQAIKDVPASLVALDCLGQSLPKGTWIKLSRGIQKLMRNTKERDAHMWKIDSEYFGGKVLGYGDLTNIEIKKMCEEGNY